MKVVRHVLSLYEKTASFELMLPDTVSDFAVLRSIIAAQGLHVDPVDLPPMTMDGPFLSFIDKDSKVRYAVTTSNFNWPSRACCVEVADLLWHVQVDGALMHFGSACRKDVRSRRG